MVTFSSPVSRGVSSFLAAVIAAILPCCIPTTGVQAAAGDLDPAFGMGGKTTTSFSNASDLAYATTIQPDGRIVVVGTVSDSGPNGGFAIARYTTVGNLDSSFGNGGKVTTKLTLGFDSAHAVAIQADGKIVVAGDFNVAGFALLRYNSDGSLDPTFGAAGKVLTPSSFSGNAAYGIAIQADGKLVVIGSTNLDFAVVRYNTDGSLDSSFGSNGRVVIRFTAAYSNGWGVAIQTDQKIIAVGYTYNGNANQDFAIARLNTDGGLDSSFGSGGKVITTFTAFDDNAYSVAIQPNGKIVVGGGIYGFYAFALARYNVDGSLDTGFGDNGKVITTSPDRSLYGFAIALQPNGKIVAAGYAIFGAFATDFAVVRYHLNGGLDSGFGNGGIVITDFGSTADIAWDIAVQADGKIVVIGFGAVDATSYDFAIARYSGDGSTFDICIQDDSNHSLFLQFNSTTGEYQFTNCAGLVLGGTGALIQRGGTITLQDNTSGRRVLARIDNGVSRAIASIQLLSQGTTFTITDRNTANNTCACSE